MPYYILGISAYYHDSAAALICDGEILAAAQEERFSRVKHDSGFPSRAVEFVLKEAGIRFGELSAVSFYDKPFIKFERLLETYHAFAPRGLVSFLEAVPVWIKEKLFMKKMLKDELKQFGTLSMPLLFPEHHLSHAASAYYPSPFNEAAILTIDGVGEWATTTVGLGRGKDIRILEELHFPHSLGLLYSAFTYYTGFRVNSGEYKLMGLAPYGSADSPQTLEFKDKIRSRLVDIREDGSLLLNMKYFRFATGLRMTHDKKWTELFGIPPRVPESEIAVPYMNLALAIQQVTEEIVLKLAAKVREKTECRKLVMAGGVALNSVANGKILQSGMFEDIWIQPAAGDSGGALGAALAAWHIWAGKERNGGTVPDAMSGSKLGPAFSKKEMLQVFRKYGAVYTHYDDFSLLARDAAEAISRGKVVGWFQGRMEFGPRALGNRSILGDARNPEMQKKMNLKIKYREGFRPFAPAVLEEDAGAYFELDRPSPYMLLVVPVNQNRRKPLPDNLLESGMYERLYHARSDIPAVTHIDYSARVQTVSAKTHPRFWNLISEFKKQTGCGVVINTSFNVRGEPIVCSPDDAYQCFMRTEMDALVMGNYLLLKEDQKKTEGLTAGTRKIDPD